MGFSLSSITGGLLNSITGATSAGKQSQKYALQSAQVNNAYQKEFAKNAHQWEMADLKKAGLNPVLSANGGASASGGGVSSGTVSNSGINPIETAIGAWNGYEQARNTGADTNRKNAEVANVNADTLLKHWQTITEMEKGPLTKAERQKLEAEKNMILKTMPYITQQEELKRGLISAQTEEAFENAKFQKRRASGKGWSANVYGGSYNY